MDDYELQRMRDREYAERAAEACKERRVHTQEEFKQRLRDGYYDDAQRRGLSAMNMAPPAPPPPTVAAAIEQAAIEQAVTRLDLLKKSITLLIERIDPVIRPTPSATADQSSPSQMQASPVRERLDALTNHIDKLRDVVGQATNSIDL